MDKVEHTYAIAPDRFRSMRELLQEEVHVKLHSAETGLADPSAAMGLLWARRGLSYWIALFRPIREWQAPAASWSAFTDSAADAPAAVHGSPATEKRAAGAASGYHVSMRAYEETLGRFAGWVSRNMFTIAARATPELRTWGPALASSPAALQADVNEWCASVEPVLARMSSMSEDLDIEDMRKTI